ncbi:MAG: CoA transferase [Gammaproteobacteria bacterium]|nr:CoA transferase [Gammaproteobacteria bacterium]
MNKQRGPLVGLKVVEFAGLGPAPFCGLLLSDMGATVTRIDRAGGEDYQAADVESRGRHSVVLDLKSPAGQAAAFALLDDADVLIEGFRPGVMERLGLGPDVVLTRNPRIIYGRMTGWGQTGPLAPTAGHDINYLALTGALHAIGPARKPAVPLNLVADFGGGALYLAMGILAALNHVHLTGQGQVIDCAMIDGVTSMLGMIHGDHAVGLWRDERETNVIDGAAPFYDTYRCSDGKWLAVGAIEAPFYATLLKLLELTDIDVARQWQRDQWPEVKARVAERIATRTRSDWCDIFAGHDACVTPVLSLAEAPHHPHNQARQGFVEIDGIVQPAPAPRFSLTPGAVQFGPRPKGGG